MTARTLVAVPKAMAFYHEDGLVPAWKQASRFAGKGGRLATLPDVIDARLATEPGATPWERYFTTTTAEFLGTSRGGNRILIVVHGAGPMSTLDGVLAAYKHQFSDKDRNRRGGRIQREEFLRLESGAYGAVEVVDFAEMLRWHRYPFLHHATGEEGRRNPLLRARLGARWEEYLTHHWFQARVWHRQEGHGEIAEPIIVQSSDASNCSYEYSRLSSDEVLAHLVSIGGLANCHLGRNDYPGCPDGNLTTDIHAHEWNNGVRFVGVRDGEKIAGIHEGPDAYELLRRHWRKLMRPIKPQKIGLRHAVQVGKEWFTEVLKKGDGMDTGEPEFHVAEMVVLGTPVVFQTTVGGYHGLFKYGIKEVEAIAPKGANVYIFTTDPEIIWTDGNPTHHRALVQFYRAKVDTSQRLVREGELRNDYSTLMSLIGEGDE